MLGPFEDGSLKPSARKIVLCGEVEARVFGPLPNDGSGEKEEKRDSVSETTPDHGTLSEANGLEEQDEDESDGGVAIPESRAADGDKKSDQAELTPQQAGRRRATNREKVRQAARRGVVFGFPIDPEGYTLGDASCLGEPEASQRVPCRVRAEAVQGGRVVEASFAKGEWGVRWRDVA